MIGTTASERAKLSAIRSIVSILFFFLSGNRVKLSKYPGMNKRKGKPKMICMVPSMFVIVIGIRMVLQIRHSRMSVGGLFIAIFMFHQSLMLIGIMLIISFINIRRNMISNPLMRMFIFFFR